MQAVPEEFCEACAAESIEAAGVSGRCFAALIRKGEAGDTAEREGKESVSGVERGGRESW